MTDLIKRDAIDLKKSIQELDRKCDTTRPDMYRKEFYTEGKRALEVAIQSEGRETMAAFIAGSNINDFIQDNVYAGKFMKCGDK